MSPACCIKAPNGIQSEFKMYEIIYGRISRRLLVTGPSILLKCFNYIQNMYVFGEVNVP